MRLQIFAWMSRIGGFKVICNYLGIDILNSNHGTYTC